jgi:hypothetical protein
MSALIQMTWARNVMGESSTGKGPSGLFVSEIEGGQASIRVLKQLQVMLCGSRELAGCFEMFGACSDGYHWHAVD